MRDYDPWVFEMLWMIEQREQEHRLATARLARLVWEIGIAGSSGSGVRRTRRQIGQRLSALMTCVWVHVRDSTAKLS